MTLTDTVAPRVATPARPARRWHRVVIPFGVLFVFWLWTVVAHSWEQPSRSDPGTLSPTGTGSDGSSRLAGLLAQRGVDVQRVSSTNDAVRQARDGLDATIFVPAPDYLDGTLTDQIAGLPGQYRIVLVQPGVNAQIAAQVPLFGSGSRWATRSVAPDCPQSGQLGGGPAAVLHDAFDVDPDQRFETTVDCYRGGLVGARFGGTEVLFVGASDPFRNARIDEAGNAAFAVGLLGTGRRVIWLDLHRREPRPPVHVATPHLPAVKLPQYRRGEQDRSDTGFPTIDAFPPLLWASLILIAGAAVLLGVARARRLGPPVAEPLPVLVPAAEAVTGRGRLYRRIKAREPTLDALRTAAIGRIVRVLYPFGAAPPERDLLRAGPAADRLVADIAARTGASEVDVAYVLYGMSPVDDEALAAAVDELDAFVAAVLHQPGRAQPEENP